LKQSSQKAYRALLANSTAKRSEIETSRVFKPALKKQLLTDFDHEEEHLNRLQRFLHEPTFDEWVELNR